MLWRKNLKINSRSLLTKTEHINEVKTMGIEWEISLNANVRIEPTPKGIKTLEENHIEPNKYGEYILPLWEVMGIFGQFLQYPNVGARGQLEEAAIHINSDDLK